MSRSLFTRLRGLTVLLVLLSAISAGGLAEIPAWAAPPRFNDPGFENTWNRTDKPVDATSNTGRGYTWGPVAPGASEITTETYNGGTRKVQYFDKARLEVNNPQ